MLFKVECLLPIELDEYLQIRDDEEFRALQCKHLALDELSILEDAIIESSGSRCQTICTKPYIPLPEVLKTMLGDREICFIDRLEFPSKERAKGEKLQLEFSTTSPLGGDDSRIVQGQLSFEAVANKEGKLTHTKQVLEGECIINVWGVSSLIEDIIVTCLRNTYRKLPHVVEEWMKEVDADSEDASIESDGDGLTRSDSDAMELSVHNLNISSDIELSGKHRRSDSTSSWASLSLGFF